MKTLKTLGTLVSLTLIALSTGCGKAPELPTLTTSPTDTVATVEDGPTDTYDAAHVAEACTAIRNWVPAAKTIVAIESGSATAATWTFANSGITQKQWNGVPYRNGDGYTMMVSFPGHCVVTITGSRVTAVN